MTVCLLLDSFKNGKLDLKIEIQYLAEIIDPHYKFFHLEIYGYEPLELVLWQKNKSPIIDLAKISKYELEILESKIEDGKIKIMGMANQGNIQDELGATLSLQAKKFGIKDEKYNPISLSKLKEIGAEYWKNFNTC